MAANTVLNYLPRESVVHRLTGTTKLAFFLLFTFASMITYNTWVLLGLLAVSISAFKLSKIRFKEVRFMMIFMLVFLLLNNLFIFLFDPDQGTTLYGTRHVLSVEFSFFVPQQYGSAAILTRYPSYSEMLEDYYATKDRAERLRQKSRELYKAVHNMYDRAVRKQAARKEELSQSAKADTLRLYGELLQANLWAIHKGDRQVTVQNYYTGEDVTIRLDPRLGGNENAQKYFRDYKKKQTAHAMLQKLLVEGEAEIEYLRTVLYEVESAPGEMALNEIRAELKSQGYLKYYKQRDRKQKPADFLRYTSSDGFEILVGRNNLQNDKLTLHTARGKDLWFHIQKAPGSHCVVMSRGEDIPDTTKQEAAELAVLHSSQNGGAKVAVDTTEVKNIWKANGAKPGMVLYEVYTTVYVTPREGLEEQLKKR